jgi:hypothetical protein
MLILAATIDRFESLKGLGVEATTRRLGEKIVEAEDVLRRLRQLAELTGATLVDLNTRSGRMGMAPSATESLDLARRVRSILVAIGTSEEGIKNALQPWARITCLDMSRALILPLEAALKAHSHKINAGISAHASPKDPHDEVWDKLLADRREVSDYSERLRHFDRFELGDFPEKFLAVFDEAPLPAAQRSALKEEASRFASAMRDLRDLREVRDPQALQQLIDQLRPARA